MSSTVLSAKNVTCSMLERPSPHEKKATAHRLSVNNAQRNKKEHLQALYTNQGEKIEKQKNEG
jgi:hypothetical protein